MANSIPQGVNGVSYIDFSAPVSVNTLTPLMPWTDVGHGNKIILFVCTNLDPTNAVNLVIENSEDESHVDDSITQNILIPPLRQGSWELGPDSVRNIWRMSAHTNDPGYPTVLVKWMLRVRTAFH
jgi:hypothetical protein